MRSHARSLAFGLALALALLAAVASLAQAPRVQEVAGELESLVEQLRVDGVVEVGEVTVSRSDLLLGVYEQRGFEPLWADASALEALMRAVAEVHRDGLNPDHYHLSTLGALASGPRTATRLAQIDLLATHALIHVSHHLRFGKVEPEGPAAATDSPWPFGGPDPVADLVRVAASGKVDQAMRALRSEHFVYQGLVEALEKLRGIESAAGWAVLPSGPTLGRDSVDARVPLLRRRLATSGDMPQELVGEDPRFDPALEMAVRSFQHRHGLNEDGVVGPATLAELNVPVEHRIEQLRVNLERARWVAHGLPQTFVAANIAGAKVYLVRGDSVALETRAIVGRDYTRTPIFSAPMRYIDLNPTWTVPPGLVGQILAKVTSDPDYLDQQGMRVLDSAGRAPDTAEIDFARYTAASFPYIFRQDPGPENPLGQIKFMFPNPYHVYIHDTPARTLFDRKERLFSQGCIRIEDPLALAELLLDDPRWSREALRAEIALGATRTISLEQPLPVLVLYWTASTDLHGELHFYRDVYGRDASLLQAIDSR